MSNVVKRMEERKYLKLRKLLSIAALAVALISWYTTANGLREYVFEHMWQAYIISAAIQGALFALSIMGIDLVLGLRTWWKKLFLVVVWSCLLCTSSIFSYIYVSGDVYDDILLREDAQRVLSTYCLQKNYELSSEADKLLHGSGDLDGIKEEMDKYIALLAVTENGVVFSDTDEELLSIVRSSLLPYAYNYSGDKSGSVCIEECIDASFLVDYLDVIIEKKYTDKDIEALKDEIGNVTKAIEVKVEEVKGFKATKEKTANGYQIRLDGYRETSSAAYTSLCDDLKKELDEIEQIDINLSKLNAEQNNINKVETIIDAVQKSMGTVLYNLVLQIRAEMNEEEISVETVQVIAEEIYNTLIENGVTADDERLMKYAEFRNNLHKYSAITKTQQLIEMEIEKIYDLTGNKEVLTESTLANVLTNDEVAWNSYWKTRLNSLKKSIQTMRRAGLDVDVINNLIESIDAHERLYLSNLNDFERAFALLFDHPYRVLLVFSFCFSFGLDLFAVLMSCLLYLFRVKANNCNLLNSN